MSIQTIEVRTTVASKEAAETIARRLIEQRLAACVQISGPIESVYRWQGEIEKATEWVCAAKTIEAAWRRLEQTIRQLHEYDEPEIIVTPIVAGSETYLKWLAEQVEA